MSQEVPKPQAEPMPREVRPQRLSVLWRVLAIAAILAAMVAVAHFLQSPARFEAGGKGLPAAAPDAFSATPPAPEVPSGSEARKEAMTDLRKVMAGILMDAAQEQGPYQDPRNQTPEARRRFLADRFALPFDYPRSQVPPGLLPDGARLLVAFENPEGNGARMALARLPGDIHVALATVQKHYKAQGWTMAEPPEPRAQTDEGWLVRFARQGRERIVYAQPRRSGDETLVAIYDAPR
jgi:hypothetical protein